MMEETQSLYHHVFFSGLSLSPHHQLANANQRLHRISNFFRQQAVSDVENQAEPHSQLSVKNALNHAIHSIQRFFSSSVSVPEGVHHSGGCLPPPPPQIGRLRSFLIGHHPGGCLPPPPPQIGRLRSFLFGHSVSTDSPMDNSHKEITSTRDGHNIIEQLGNGNQDDGVQEEDVANQNQGSPAIAEDAFEIPHLFGNSPPRGVVEIIYGWIAHLYSVTIWGVLLAGERLYYGEMVVAGMALFLEATATLLSELAKSKNPYLLGAAMGIAIFSFGLTAAELLKRHDDGVGWSQFQTTDWVGLAISSTQLIMAAVDFGLCLHNKSRMTNFNVIPLVFASLVLLSKFYRTPATRYRMLLCDTEDLTDLNVHHAFVGARAPIVVFSCVKCIAYGPCANADAIV